MNINFITSEKLDSMNGGWSGMNYQLYNHLKKKNSVNYIGPIRPSVNILEKIISKSFRIFHFQSLFYYFSEKRLNKIALLTNQLISQNTSNVHIFHGATPWIKIKPAVPYYAYLDASFPTFMVLYSNPKLFQTKDLKRIENQEKTFLQNAQQVFFSSQWALDEAKSQYNVSGENFSCVGLGGNIEIPEQINLTPKKQLIFISVNFEKKGGLILFDAYKILKQTFSDLTISIIGQKPPDHVINYSGITYHGFLDKSNPKDLSKFTSILSESMLLVHPTKMDMTPLVIVEAGYYGVPAMAPNTFGISEMIQDNHTGFLLQENSKYEIIEKIEYFLINTIKFKDIRNKVQKHMINSFTWNKTSNMISNLINSNLI